METNVYARWEATLFKAHWKVKFRFTDVKRPNAGHVSMSSGHFSSSEKKWDLCLLPLILLKIAWLPSNKKGCLGNIQNTKSGKGPSERRTRTRVVLAFVCFSKVLKHVGEDSCERSHLTENCYKASNHTHKNHTGFWSFKEKGKWRLGL